MPLRTDPPRRMGSAVAQTLYPDTALVLVAHGSSKNSGSAEPAYGLAEAIRQTGQFAGVAVGFHQQEPRVSEIVGGLAWPRVFVVPLFVGEGYFTRRLLPQALGLAHDGPIDPPVTVRRGALTLTYCAPVGTHPGVTDLLLARARDTVQQHPGSRAPGPEELTLFLAGHGTRRTADSRRAVERHVERVRRRGLYAAVQALFLEDDPPIAACYQLAPTRGLVVVPVFISDGLHVAEDLPVLLGEPAHSVQARLARGEPPWLNPTERQGKLVWYAPGLGGDPLLGRIVLQRVREAAEADRTARRLTTPTAHP